MIPQNISSALHLIANGVFVVAASHEGETHGCTVTWASQASYRHPLLTVSLDKRHDTYKLIESSHRLVINVLKASQADLAEQFGHATRPPQGGYFREEGGQLLPELKDCLAVIHCDVVDTLDARDHAVLLVEAKEARVLAKGDPLLYSIDHGYMTPQPKQA